MSGNKRPTRREGQLRPGPHGLPAEEVERSQRQRLLSGVIEVVADSGYEGARVQDIIAAAGVSRKTFYEHFDEKEDCFLAAYDVELRGLTEATTGAFADAGDSWADQVTAGLQGMLGYLAEHPDAARVCMVEVMGAGPRAMARRDAALRSFTHLIDAGRGQTDQEVPGRTALAVIGALNELIAAELVHGSADRLPALAPDAVYLVCLPFLGPRRALQARADVSDPAS